METNQRKLESLLEDEEVYWKQRSREEWLNWGDRNTKWFHLKASKRRSINRIQRLRNAMGNWVEDDVGMEEMVNQYFQTLFQSSNPDTESIDGIL